MPNPDFGPGGVFLTSPPNWTEPRVSMPQLVDLDINQAYGYGVGTLQYWTRYLQAGSPAITLTIALDRPAVGTESITWDVIDDPDSAEGVYFTTSSKTINPGVGVTSVSITITPTVRTAWFFEKWVKIAVTGGTGIHLANKVVDVDLCFYPSAGAPLVSIAGGSDTLSTGDLTATIPVTLSAISDEDTRVRARATGDLAPHITFGVLTIPAGQTTGNLLATYDDAGTPGDTASVVLLHEVNLLDYSDNRFDPDAGTYTGALNSVFTEENQWRTSDACNNAGIYETPQQDAEHTHPGRPSNLASGSINLVPHKGHYLRYENQLETGATKKVCPWFGDDLRATRNPRLANGDGVEGGNGSVGLHYERQEFDSQFCGGEEAFHSLKNYYMTGFCVSEWGTADAGREWPFHRVGVRIRSKDRNHGVIFATNRDPGIFAGTPGTNRWGDTGMPVWVVDGVSYWLWDVARRPSSSAQGVNSQCHPNSTMRFDADGTGTNDATKGDYGVVDMTEFGLGAFLWFKHFIDPAAVYLPTTNDYSEGDADGLPQSSKETAGVDDCNAINYRGWLASDGTNVLNLTQFHAQNRGVLAHNFYAHTSDSDISVPVLPWPCKGSMHSPLGNALLDVTSGTFTITSA